MRRAMLTAMVTSIVLLCRMPAFAGDLPDGVTVIDCLWPDTAPVGAAVQYHALIVNNGKRRLVVVAPRILQDSQKARFFVGRGSPCQYQLMKARGIPFVPSRGLVALGPRRITLEAGEMGTWDVPLPAPGTDDSLAVGKHHVSVDLALGYPAYSGKTARKLGNQHPPKGVIVIKNIESKDPSDWSVTNAFHHEFSSSFTLTEPSGKDKVYYERYLETWLHTRDCDDYVQSVLGREEVRRSLSQETKPAGPYRPPFSEIKQRQSFKELEDNRYAAMAGYGGSLKVELLNAERRYLSTKNGYRYARGSPTMTQLLFSFEKAGYYVDTFNLWWNAYLGAAVSLFGTSREQRGLKAVQRIATESPDCVARYLAKRVLEVYEEVRGGKRE